MHNLKKIREKDKGEVKLLDVFFTITYFINKI